MTDTTAPNGTLIRELLAEHKTAADKLKKYKAKEGKLKAKIVELLFPDPKKGTNKVSFKEAGLDVKIVVPETWSIKQEELLQVLEEDDTLVRAFKYKHELVKAGYDSLSDEQKKSLANIVTAKLGSPTLTYEGELGQSFINEIAMPTESVAKYYGFENVESLKQFLEDIK